MIKDLPENKVEGISIAVVLESEAPEAKHWKVYLINQKAETIENILVTSKGYGQKEGKEVKTSTLRHSMGTLNQHSFAAIEAIDEAVFGLANEYWLSFYIGNQLFDKKFVFLPESIVDANLIRIPLVNKPGVMIGQ
ncbi:MAG: hypothetical protein ACKOW2_09550 [Sphingobacteriaceae bacterium]